MIIDFVFAGIIGFCGTRWPIRLPFPPRPKGGGPDDPWPPDCPQCDFTLGILGGIAVIYLSGLHFTETGTLAAATLTFFGGSFAAQLGGLIRGMMVKSKP